MQFFSRGRSGKRRGTSSIESRCVIQGAVSMRPFSIIRRIGGNSPTLLRELRRVISRRLKSGSSNRTVDNFIVKLRKKIEKSPDKPEHILTVYGYGYKLAP